MAGVIGLDGVFFKADDAENCTSGTKNISAQSRAYSAGVHRRRSDDLVDLSESTDYFEGKAAPCQPTRIPHSPQSLSSRAQPRDLLFLEHWLTHE
jgi:hypothetical protein